MTTFKTIPFYSQQDLDEKLSEIDMKQVDDIAYNSSAFDSGIIYIIDIERN